MIAVIEIGSKQYLIEKGKIITVDKIEGKELIFDKVLLYYDKNKTILGKPYLLNVFVKGEIVNQIKKKIHIIKFKPKTRYKKKLGYKNYFTQIKINDIVIK
ncbi:MAG: 50S ribosomal protein L21 [Patescibacteria group bacterium]|nr:50S ribosomal protein L21 [Patescibacteria group bacterium]